MSAAPPTLDAAGAEVVALRAAGRYGFSDAAALSGYALTENWTFKVTEAGLDELTHYELTNAQGEVIDGGMRGSPLDDFLEMAIGIEDKDI